MTQEKICICNPVQSEIKASEAVDFIGPDGKITARYAKNCDVHGYKIIETKEK
jgi:hypothetical protein